MAVNGDTLQKSGAIRDPIIVKVYDHGVSHGRSEAGYDIRIKQDVRFYRTKKLGRAIIRSQGKQHHFQKGRFCTASAMEEFDMPPDLLAVVHDKSTWARKGLSVFNTVIEPGWKGFLTLELVYHGEGELFIPAGSGIAQVLFSKVSDPVVYIGRYQNQADEPVEAISSQTYLEIAGRGCI